MSCTTVLPYAALPRTPRVALPRPRVACAGGFTLLEVVITIAIVGILAQIAIVAYQNYRERVDVARAAVDIGTLGAGISQYGVEHHGLPSSLADIGRAGVLDPWGNPYQYLNHDGMLGNGQLRKDKNIVPINSDFDLYSMGKDGKSESPLTASASRDDIVRANNGRFVGVASVYDP